MKLRPGHVDALGGCAPCRFTPLDNEQAPPPASERPPGPSVRQVGENPDAWIGIELLEPSGAGEGRRPVAGEAYEVILPDGTPVSGNLDAKGKVLLVGFEPGNLECVVTFPNLDRRDFLS
ncbi:MAG: hypothetical protein AB7R55_16610 [Gemmatimonadales bacterium]